LPLDVGSRPALRADDDDLRIRNWSAGASICHSTSDCPALCRYDDRQGESCHCKQTEDLVHGVLLWV
jgi:hypothetical protein